MAATLVDVWRKRYDQAIMIWHGTTTYQDHKALAFRGIFFSFEKLHISSFEKNAPANDYPTTQIW
jgi:hypothetical protein